MSCGFGNRFLCRTPRFLLLIVSWVKVGQYGPLTGGLFTSKLWEACVSWDVRPLPAAESTEGKSSCGLSGWSVIGAGRVGLVESEDRTRQQHTGVGIKGKKSGYATEARTYARLREYVPDMSIHATACRSANTIDRLPRGVQ
jgi:hypothetical protein